MGNDPSQFSPMFSIDVTAEPGAAPRASRSVGNANEPAIALLHEMVAAQQKQNQLLEQLVQTTVNAQKQRTTELQQWKDANPRLSSACRKAAEKLSGIQAEFLETLTKEIDENDEHMFDGDYMLNEFLDRFGPRLAHLNGVLQVLAQLGSSQPPQQ